MLTAALNIMHKHSVNFETPGPQDVFDYGIGPLWRKGIDGAGIGCGQRDTRVVAPARC